VKIRFNHPATVRIDFRPGDEVIVQAMTPALEALARSPRLDGALVAQVISGDDQEELAVMGATGETAITGRGRRGSRADAVSK
jgi:hypothetical protein